MKNGNEHEKHEFETRNWNMNIRNDNDTWNMHMKNENEKWTMKMENETWKWTSERFLFFSLNLGRRPTPHTPVQCNESCFCFCFACFGKH